LTFALLRPGEFRLYYTDDSGTAVAINRVIAGSEGRLVSEKQFQSRSVPNDDDDGTLNLELQLQAEAELEDERETAAQEEIEKEAKKKRKRDGKQKAKNGGKGVQRGHSR
jgi:hypothetical protein